MTIAKKYPQLKSILVVALILSLIFALTACKEATAKVRTGTRVVCKYGDLIQDSTKEIRVSKTQVDKYHVITLRKLCKKHEKLENLQRAAREALEAGDEAEAEEIIQKIVSEEPRLRAEAKKKAGDEKAQLEVIEDVLVKQEAESTVKLEGQAASNSSNLPRPEGTGSPAPVEAQGLPNSSSETTELEVDIGSLIPVSITGYYSGSLSAGTNFAVRDFQPKGGNKDVEFLLITLHLQENEEGSKRFIERVSKVAFPQDAQMVTIDGKSAYFGTDGSTYGNLSWYEDKIVYEVQMMSATGEPKELYDYIVNIGKLIAQGEGQ